MIGLWKYDNLDICPIFAVSGPVSLDHYWTDATGVRITLRETIASYLDHLTLHLAQIDEIS